MRPAISIYCAYLNLESLGGCSGKIPQTALLFLLSALAICGLPPFNGFISEFILYSGLYQGSLHANPIGALLLMLSILGLALIGGLALLCFTKAFGIVFLGNARKPLPQSDWKERAGNLIPLIYQQRDDFWHWFIPGRIYKIFERSAGIVHSKF
jgi:formate hydrogenlyase subunit 3/multisubunit Na+/H+ antiporter MnhD subunit